jgi:hypothetical protein
MPELLLIHIPGPIEPLERGERFEDPLDEALSRRGKLGQCVGGGTAMDASFTVTGCDIEVEVTDVAKALPVIRACLESAKAPAETIVSHPETERTLLRFTKAGVRISAATTRKPKKRFVDSCPWQRGEVLAYRLTRDRHVLLHVYGFGGIGPVFWIPEWCGREIPGAQEIRRLIRARPENYRLGSVFEAWRQHPDDRDERRLTTTGVVVPLPPNSLRGWSPGVTQVRLWKKFERMLKEVFGLIKVSPAVRLNHDLGLLTRSAHMAVWDAAKKVNKHDAKRLFYANASRFRRNRPGPERQPVTERLKAFVADLKTGFDSKDVWEGKFSAQEGFVIVPVKRRQFRPVWAAAGKLARKRGLACYDPETERLL